MDTLGYAPESVHQHETWQLGLPAHFPTELPNIAPLSQENIEASLPPQSLLLMHDISNLMAAITMAMGPGPNTSSYILAQTFHPLIHMAVGLQVSALQGAGGGGAAAPADQILLPATGSEYYQRRPASMLEAKSEKDAAEEDVPKSAAGKKRKGVGAGGEGSGQRQQQNASNREPRRKKTSSRFSDYINIDDV
ncbi:hypothetical protein Ndes2526B_g01122 [Nannochloris sp. 'desiccata']|nr:hypothetical protein NADE_008689 [Chlorella desiccata (nom. nud.)]